MQQFERTCRNCNHEHLDIDELPCLKCEGCNLWEQKIKTSLWSYFLILIVTAIFVAGLSYSFIRGYTYNTSLFWLEILFVLPIFGAYMIYLYTKGRLQKINGHGIISIILLIMAVMSTIAQYLW
jgi:hypothetical protein